MDTADSEHLIWTSYHSWSCIYIYIHIYVYNLHWLDDPLAFGSLLCAIHGSPGLLDTEGGWVGQQLGFQTLLGNMFGAMWIHSLHG